MFEACIIILRIAEVFDEQSRWGQRWIQIDVMEFPAT